MLTRIDALARTFVSCCEARRIEVVQEQSQAADAGCRPWAVIEAESGFGGAKRGAAKRGSPLRLSCCYMPTEAAAAQLVVEAAHTFDPVHVVNAFLDLVIDGATGRWHMTRAEAWGQYSFEPDCRFDHAQSDLRRAV
jgi:hypothetical protein